MRDIKFRMWNGKKMFHDVLAGFHSVEYLVPGVGDWKRISRAECEVMQFTGLKDKNDKEIYEGDIIRRSLSGATPTIIQTVYYHKCSFVIGEGDFAKPLANFCTLEIIGNIHENPQLIKA